jgi:hypothetical protein
MAEVQPIPRSLPSQFRREYDIWKAMRNRCCNPNNPSWRYYGAKGVAVCERWQQSFAAFLDDMGPAPSPEHQIDRLKNESGYEPGNCHWSTPAEQQQNTSKVHFLEYRGVRLPAYQWADVFGIPPTTLKSRIGELGWSVEQALTTPVHEELRQKTWRLKPR